MNRKPLLAKIHIARKELQLDHDEYRALLLSTTGKASAADCTEAELEKALRVFERLGWKPKKVRQSDKPHVRKIYAIWGDLKRRGAIRNGSRNALVAMVKRMAGVDDPEWLTIDGASKIIEALKAMQVRTPGGAA